MKEPLVSIALKAYTRIFSPGDELTADFQIDAVELGDIEAVEASVLWYTEGKGDEDLGVHFFKRFDGHLDPLPLHEFRSIATTLPESPLSYDGRIVKIRWCVRVRAFLSRGRYVVADQWFQLGNVPGPMQVLGDERAADGDGAGDVARGGQRGGRGSAERVAGRQASTAAIY
jgi:hypothetical protein